MGPKPRSKSERFSEKFIQRGDDDCWPWIGQVDVKNKRGKFYWDAATGKVNAARALFLLAGTELRHEQMICHTCDNPNCVNPKHLYLGSALDNVRDARTRGQWQMRNPRKGERHPMASITEKTAAEILKRAIKGERGSAIARAFGVSKGVVSMIKTRRSWRHLHG